MWMVLDLGVSDIHEGRIYVNLHKYRGKLVGRKRATY